MYTDELSEKLKNLGQTDAFIHGWLDGQFDGIRSQLYTGEAANMYNIGFVWGTHAAIMGEEAALVDLEKELSEVTTS